MSATDSKTETIEGSSSTYTYGYDASRRLESVKQDGVEIAAVANCVTARFGAKVSSLTARDVAELRRQVPIRPIQALFTGQRCNR